MSFCPVTRKPDFKNMQLVLEKKAPSRPTLFEFFLNGPLYTKLAGDFIQKNDKHETWRWFMHAYKNAGYDFVTIAGSSFAFPSREIEHRNTISLNDGATIYNRKSLDSCPFKTPDEFDYSILKDFETELPDGMKFIVYGPGGVLENVISLVGYDNLCFMLYDDPQLCEDIFEKVGSLLVRHYELCGGYKTVGAMISNDDWGFNHQTMLSVKDMRKYVFPWHKRIVEAIHNAGVPAILHSCGRYDEIIDDVIYDMKYDARHSYEDNIRPIEAAYEELAGKIAVLGGIDIGMMISGNPDDIHKRSRAMIERTMLRGGYALGTGNSVPESIPDENYFAMISAALE